MGSLAMRELFGVVLVVRSCVGICSCVGSLELCVGSLDLKVPISRIKTLRLYIVSRFICIM